MEPRDSETERILAAKLDCPAALVRCYAAVDSTMDAAARLLSAAAPAWVVVLAQEQRAGRGRLGNRWQSAPGALYLTVGWPLGAVSSRLAGFSLAAAVAAAECCERCGAAVRLKWPNDLMSAEGRKVAGILIEQFGPEGRQHLLVGVGMNLTAAPDLEGVATLKELCGCEVSPVAMAGGLALALRENWASFIGSGREALRTAWLQRALYLGREVVVATGAGEQSGVFTGIDADGALLLQSAGEQHRFCAGHLRPALPPAGVE